MTDVEFDSLVRRFRLPDIKAIAVAGSFARGDAGPYSDVDLLCFRKTDLAPHNPVTHLIGQRCISVSEVNPSSIERYFTDPVAATECMQGLRTARPLWDPDRCFATVQDRARAFAWDLILQEKANAWASAQMVFWIEEAYKGMEGLRRGDVGRMLNARYGLSWGLTKVVRVQRGILITSDNTSYTDVVNYVGTHKEWSQVSVKAFGLTDSELRDQVRAGLRLYTLTAALLVKALRPEDKKLVDETVLRINRELGETPRSPLRQVSEATPAR